MYLSANGSTFLFLKSGKRSASIGGIRSWKLNNCSAPYSSDGCNSFPRPTEAWEKKFIHRQKVLHLFCLNIQKLVVIPVFWVPRVQKIRMPLWHVWKQAVGSHVNLVKLLYYATKLENFEHLLYILDDI